MSSTTSAAVIGHPVGHSLSPAMFNAAFAHDGRPWQYEAIDVTLPDLSTFVRRVRDGEFGAFSVTMPLKESVIELLDDVDHVARSLHAVNSVRVTPDGLRGFNTDGDGCCDALQHIGAATFNGARCVVFGAGGTARSVALSLLRRGAHVALVNRSADNARRAVGLLSEASGGADIRIGELGDIAHASILVNTTPVGMGADTGSVIADGSLLSRDAVVLDAVYQPLETSLLKLAHERGLRTVDGLWMLVYQAVRQYELWFGSLPSAAIMRDAAERELARRRK